MNNRFKKILCSFVVICISVLVSSNIFADNLSDYQKDLQRIKNEIKNNSNALSGVEREISMDMYDLIELDDKMTTYAGKLDEIQTKINDVNKRLEEQENLLQTASITYNASQELYITRLKVIYENGYPSLLDILFSSKSIADFFSRLNVYDSILEYDKSMVSNMDSQKEYISSVKNSIGIEKTQLEQLEYDYGKSKETLQLAVEAKQNKIKELEKQKSALNEKAKLLEKQEKEAKDKVTQELLSLAMQNSQYAGIYSNEFVWPCPGNYIVTALFYEKEYQAITGMAHTGFDLGVATGTPVVAMADGKVVRAGYNAGGYGYYIVIDHGTSEDGYVYYTLYAHNSVLKVNLGEIVKAGQQISLSGNTGNSTGPHLHVEVNRTKAGAMWSIDPMLSFIGSVGIKYKLNGQIVDYPWTTVSGYQYGKEIRRSYSY